MVRTKGTGSVFPLCAEKHGCPPRVGKVRPEHDCKAPWRGQIEAGYTASGARRYITVTGRSQKAAATKLRAKVNEIEARGVPKAGAATVTVKRWSQVWLPIYAEQVRPSRFTDARGVVRRYIVPTIGGRRLSQLTPADVREVHKAPARRGYGPATSLRAHNVLMVMLKAAQRDGHTVPGNVMLVKAPKQGESDRDAIPIPDAVAILQAAAGHADASRWMAAFLQGMRQGECLGLTWSCVDLERGLIDVSWQLQRLPYEDKAAGVFRVPPGFKHKRLEGAAHLVRPKTAAGTRVVPIVPWMRDALVAWREVAPANEHGLVWTEGRGRPVRKVTDRAGWFALQDEAQVAHVEGKMGRRYTLHEARHTTATLLLEAGVDPHVVTAILGHSKITTSRGYQHVSMEMARKGLDKAGKLLELPAREK